MLVSAVAAFASLLLHVVLLTSAFWHGGSGRTPTPELPSTGTISSLGSDGVAMELVMIDESALSDPSANTWVPDSSIPDPGSAKVTLEFPPLEIPFEKNTSHTDDDEEASARLLDRYLGQISARIDRAWLRPRTPIGDARFRCQVRIEQDPAGNVTEVALERCNGGASWQLSLVHAIESVSPLPPPPDPSVFVRAIHLGFQSAPWETAGETAHLYEPASLADDATASKAQTTAIARLKPTRTSSAASGDGTDLVYPSNRWPQPHSLDTNASSN